MISVGGGERREREKRGFYEKKGWKVEKIEGMRKKGENLEVRK